jgi:hypothetical protein
VLGYKCDFYDNDSIKLFEFKNEIVGKKEYYE